MKALMKQTRKNKVKSLFLLLIGLIGCSSGNTLSDPLPSQLIGTWNMQNSQIIFYNNGQFTYRNFTSPSPNPYNHNYSGCSQVGTWKDLDTFSNQGQVILVNTYDT